MKALVTGGVGFVGTNLIKRLLKEGYKVVSLDNYSTGFKDNEQKGCQYFDVDLCHTYDYSFFMDKPDVIFHMGALARIQPSIKDPITAIQNNFDSTLNVLEWAKSKDCPVIFAGSSSYHHGLWGSPYAWSKHAGEQLCKLYSNVYKLPTAICRFYNVYGPHQIEEGTYATVIGIFEKQYRNNEPLTITGDGKQRRDFTHIEDIVDGLVRVNRAMMGEVDMVYHAPIFELGSGKNYSIDEVANMFGDDYPKKYIDKRSGEYDVTLADYSEAKDLLDWKPTKDLNNYINSINA